MQTITWICRTCQKTGTIDIDPVSYKEDAVDEEIWVAHGRLDPTCPSPALRSQWPMGSPEGWKFTWGTIA